jgi:hypothetical protein
MEALLARTPVFLSVLALLGLATLGLAVYNPPLVPLPVFGAIFFWVLCKVPVRHATFTVFFLALAADCLNESPYEGEWKSPLYPIGRLLYKNMGYGLTLLDAAVFGLLAIFIYRRAVGLKTDPEVVRMPQAQVLALGLVIVTILWVQVWGVSRGGNTKVTYWQFHQMAVLPIMAWLFNSVVRGPQDFRRIGQIIIACCVIKAFLGAYFIVFIARPRGLWHEYATHHSDTLLYVAGLMIAIVSYSEERTKRNFRRMLVVCSIILMGMHYNDRRLAYVSFLLSAIAWFMLSPWTHARRQVARALIILAPVLPFYFAIGWANPTGIFSLIGPFKSIIEGEKTAANIGDQAMDYRDMENFNVVQTWTKNPLLGTGWGHPFDEVIKMPDISKSFADYLYHPHNSVLGMLAYAGAIGFTGLWAYLCISQFLAVRAYHRAHEPLQRTACIVSISVFVAYVNQCFGDMGTISWIGTLLVAMAVVCVGKVATLTGAWPTTKENPSSLENSSYTRVSNSTAGTSV